MGKFSGAKAPHSSVVIARLLLSEGFDEPLIAAIQQYAKITAPNKERYEKHFHQFHEFTEKLAKEDKQLIGRFVGRNMEAAFDAGLRIGITTRLKD